MTGHRVLAAAVLVHLGASLAHGGVHAAVPVPVPTSYLGLVGLVVLGAPLVGIALVAAGRPRAGVWLIGIAAAGSFAFEGAAHFLVTNPDHVSSVADATGAFAATATVTTAGDLLLAGVAGWALWTGPRSGVDNDDPVSVG